MKMNEIYKIGSYFVLAGFMTFTFASCREDVKNNQSTYNALEERIEENESEDNVAMDKYDVNDPNRQNAEMNIYEREYTFEDADVFEEQVRGEVERANRMLTKLDNNATQAKDENVSKAVNDSKKTISQELDKVKQNLNKLEGATEETWEQVRTDINMSLERIDQEWGKIDNMEPGTDARAGRDEKGQETELQKNEDTGIGY